MTAWEERIAKEQAEQAQRNTDSYNLMVQVAVALGESWKVVWPRSEHGEHNRTRLHIDHNDGRSIHVTWDSYQHKGRFVLSGIYQYGDRSLNLSLPSAPTAPTITVANTRTAAQIAADINRRFLPDYTTLWTKMNEKVAAATATRDSRLAISKRLFAATCMVSLNVSESGFSAWDDRPNQGGRSVKVKVTGYRGIDMELENLSEDAARQIIELYNRLTKKEEPKPRTGVKMGDNVYDPVTKTWSKGTPDFSKGFIASKEQFEEIGLGKLHDALTGDKPEPTE